MLLVRNLIFAWSINCCLLSAYGHTQKETDKWKEIDANEKYSYCLPGARITLDNSCLDALLQEAKGLYTFKERRNICRTSGIDISHKEYKQITDFLLKLSTRKHLVSCD